MVDGVPHSRIARHRLQREEWVLEAAAAALGAVAHRWAHDGQLPASEQRVFEAVNELPDGLRFVWWAPMQAGNALVWVAGPLLLLAKTRRWRPAVATFAATFGGWMAAKQIKRRFRRGRPEFFLAEAVRFREEAPTGFGYVSGHAAVAFALATVLRPYLPRRWGAALFVLAPITGSGRMYFGAHLPADIIGGASLGIACGVLANAVVGVDETLERAGRR